MIRRVLCRLGFHWESAQPVFTVKRGRIVMARACEFCDWTSDGWRVS